MGSLKKWTEGRKVKQADGTEEVIDIATVPVGNHGGGCGGSLVQVFGSRFTFCMKCNASAAGYLSRARKSGEKRRARWALKRQWRQRGAA